MKRRTTKIESSGSIKHSEKIGEASIEAFPERRFNMSSFTFLCASCWGASEIFKLEKLYSFVALYVN